MLVGGRLQAHPLVGSLHGPDVTVPDDPLDTVVDAVRDELAGELPSGLVLTSRDPDVERPPLGVKRPGACSPDVAAVEAPVDGRERGQLGVHLLDSGGERPGPLLASDGCGVAGGRFVAHLEVSGPCPGAGASCRYERPRLRS